MIQWITQNWSYILSGILGLIVVASIVVKLTPSTSDDSVMGKIIDILDKFSVAKTENDKELIKIAKDNLAEDEKK